MQLLRTSEDKPLNGRPLWERSDLEAGQLVNEFQRECHVVRRSIDGDLAKVLVNATTGCICLLLLACRIQPCTLAESAFNLCMSQFRVVNKLLSVHRGMQLLYGNAVNVTQDMPATK